MLSIFPDLFSYAFVVPFIWRVVIGVAFIIFGYKTVATKSERHAAFFASFNLNNHVFLLWLTAFLSIIGGLMLIVGFLTQIVAIIFCGFLILAILKTRAQDGLFADSEKILGLLLLATLSLLFLGPGFFSIDLPL